MLPGDLPLLQVGEITAAVEAYLLRQVEFQDPVHGALEKRAVVADQDGPGPQASHEPFQDLQPGDVQVVGRSQPDPAGQKGQRAFGGSMSSDDANVRQVALRPTLRGATRTSRRTPGGAGWAASWPGPLA